MNGRVIGAIRPKEQKVLFIENSCCPSRRRRYCICIVAGLRAGVDEESVVLTHMSGRISDVTISPEEVHGG